MYYNYDHNHEIPEPSSRNASSGGASDGRGYIPTTAVPAQEAPREKKRGGKNGFLKIVAACLICAILGGVAGSALMWKVLPAQSDGTARTVVLGSDEAPASNLSVTTNITAGSKALSASDIYSGSCPSIVAISTEIATTNIFGQETNAAATGSGFVISKDGYVLTNFHVIDGYSSIKVMLYGGVECDATVVGYDDDSDIALLKIDAADLSSIAIGDSNSLTVGESIYAIGNPLGELSYTLTSGIVSALDREINTDGTPINMLQFDAAVNAGNSGGPLINAEGEVVGIVTAKYSSTGIEGLGFAIPINDAMAVVQDLLQYGYVTGKPYFGITVVTVSEDYARYYNMVVGAYINAIDNSGCAYKAGLRMGDIIISIDDTAVSRSGDLVSSLAKYKAGDTVTLKVSRSGEEQSFQVTLDEKRPSPSNASASSSSSDPSGSSGSSGYAADPFSQFFSQWYGSSGNGSSNS